MDRKSIFILLFCFGLVLLLGPLSRRLFPDIAVPAGSTNSMATATMGTNGTGTAATPSIPSIGQADSALRAMPGGNAAKEIVVDGENARYTFTADGGGLELVELTKYPQVISKESRTNPAAGGYVTLNTPIAAPTLAIAGFDSGDSVTPFTLTRTAKGVLAQKTYTNGLRVTKDFEPDSDYLIHTTVSIENTSKQEVFVPSTEWVVGTAVPMDPDDRGMNVGLMWYNGAGKTEVLKQWFSPRSIMCTPTAPRTKYEAGDNNVVWAVAENQYFALAAIPSVTASQVIARPLDLPRPSMGDASVTNNPVQQGVQSVLVYPGFALAAGQSTNTQVTLYAGPKEYKTLARIAGHMGNNLDLVMGFGAILGISLLGLIPKGLLLFMNALHLLDISYGWVIIVMTVSLKGLMWPFTAASLRTAKGMSALQPEMAKLKEKYKDDPLKLQQKTSELWKEHGVHPLNGCLPTAIQIPIFIGFFYMIRTAIELRGAHFLWINDLSKPDTIFTISGLGFLPFIGTPGVGLHVNVLPILYITTALWQTHVQPPSPGMDPGQQKLMRWMPLMFLAILYNYSSGLALYMMVSNLLTILQTKLTKHRLNSAPPTGPAAPALTYAPKKAK